MNDAQKAVIRKDLIQRMAFAEPQERRLLAQALKDLERGRYDPAKLTPKPKGRGYYDSLD